MEWLTALSGTIGGLDAPLICWRLRAVKTTGPIRLRLAGPSRSARFAVEHGQWMRSWVKRSRQAQRGTGAGLAIRVVDAFLVWTADNAVQHDHRANLMIPEGRQDFSPRPPGRDECPPPRQTNAQADWAAFGHRARGRWRSWSPAPQSVEFSRHFGGWSTIEICLRGTEIFGLCIRASERKTSSIWAGFVGSG
jgi:hypothetical protein